MNSYAKREQKPAAKTRNCIDHLRQANISVKYDIFSSHDFFFNCASHTDFSEVQLTDDVKYYFQARSPFVVVEG